MEAPLPDALTCTIDGPLSDALLCTVEWPLPDALACNEERPLLDALACTTAWPVLDALACTNEERTFEAFADLRLISRSMEDIGRVKAVFLTTDLTCTREVPFDQVICACADGSAVCPRHITDSAATGSVELAGELAAA